MNDCTNNAAVQSPHGVNRSSTSSPFQQRASGKSYSGKKRSTDGDNKNETKDETIRNNNNTAAAAATNTNWSGSGSTNSPLLSSETSIGNYNNTRPSNISAVPHTSNNNTKIGIGSSSPSTPKRTKLNNTSTSAGDENNNLSNTPEKGELHQQSKNDIVASNSQQQQANKIPPRKLRSYTALENSSTVSNETIIHDTERAKAANFVSFCAQLKSLVQEESTATDNSSEEGGVSGNGADGNEDYDFNRILPIDVIRSTDCYNNKECYQQAAVEFVNSKDPNVKYNSCIKCLINDYGAGLDEEECEGITLSMAHRLEIVGNCNDGDDVDFPSTLLLPSKEDELAEARARWPWEKKLKLLRKLAKSNKIQQTSAAPPVSLPQQSTEDIATDAELAAQGRPPRKLDNKSKGQGAAAIQNNYQLRNPNDEQPNNNFALINATNSDKYPNVHSDSFSLMPQDVYNRGILGDPKHYQNNVYVKCNICLQLIKGFVKSQDVQLNQLDKHAGACAELKRTGKMKNGKCACNATKDHAEFRGKKVDAFTRHAKGCRGTHCPKCKEDWGHLSFKYRTDHYFKKTIAHQEWEEEQKKRG